MSEYVCCVAMRQQHVVHVVHVPQQTWRTELSTFSFPLGMKPTNQNQLEPFVTANRRTICSSRKHVAHEAVCSR